MKKNYILDTNAIFEDLGECIEILRNGEENNIFIPKTVFDELDKLKRSPIKRRQVSKIVDNLLKYKDHFEILNTGEFDNSPDNKILKEINTLKDKDKYTFITNDKLFRLKSLKENIDTEEYKTSIPYKTDAEKYTGFVDLYTEDGKRKDFTDYPNSFHFDEKGRLKFYSGKKNEIEFVGDLDIWNVAPWDMYQKSLISLLDNDDIEMVSVSGKPGSGKSMLASAAALYKVLQQKKYKKIYYITSTHEVGKELGFLPGMVLEKISPFFRSINNILIELHYLRSTTNKIFIDETFQNLNHRKIEYLPINYVRGSTIKNSFVIIDEAQNFSRLEMRSILSRMGENVKVVMTGDPNQIDNNYLNKENNGLNWVVKKCRKENIYAHIQLQGQRTRGSICSLVERVGL